METGELSVPGTGGQGETREMQAQKELFTSSSCCRLLCGVGFRLEGSLPGHRAPGCELWAGLNSSVPEGKKGAQWG